MKNTATNIFQFFNLTTQQQMSLINNKEIVPNYSIKTVQILFC